MSSPGIADVSVIVIHSRASAAIHRIEARCVYTATENGDTNQFVVVEAHAAAAGHTQVVWTRVVCTVESLTFDSNRTPGNVAAVEGYGLVPNGTLTACMDAWAFFADGHDARTRDCRSLALIE